MPKECNQSVMKKWLFLLGMISVSFAETTVYLPLIPGFVQADEKGLYDRAWQKISSESGIKIDIQRIPYARALEVFRKEQKACLGIGNIETAQLYLGLEVIQSEAFFFRNEMIVGYLNTHSSGFVTRDQLAGKTGVTLLADYELVTAEYGDTMRLYSVDQAEQALKMLHAGRADVVFGNTGDLVNYLNELAYEPSLNLYESTEHFICHPDNGNEQLVEVVSEKLTKLKQTDIWKEWLASLYASE
jgi:ABC-type amino acid transport substrate-binding protein